MAIAVRWVGWWRQSSHFDWINGYLQARRMTGLARAMMAVTSSSFGLIPLLLLLSPNGPTGALRVSLASLAGAGGLACALLWGLRQPSRRISIGFVLLASASNTLFCLSQSDPRIALLACTGYATIAGYIAFFHTAPYMVYNLVVTIAVGLFEAIRLARAADAILAVCAYWIVVAINVAVPVALHEVVRAMRIDLLRSNRDPLTGLLNRRAFYDRAIAMVDDGPHSERLVVAMVDLDRFKALNDTHGHAAGDQTLALVARTLRANSPPSAVVGRVGGEEFLIAHIGALDPPELGQQLCEAVGVAAQHITASVGTSCVDLAAVDAVAAREIIDELIQLADAGMYEAKRRGGNAACHHGHRDGASVEGDKLPPPLAQTKPGSIVTAAKAGGR